MRKIFAASTLDGKLRASVCAIKKRYCNDGKLVV
jgi:hypothetical protein